jgi:hypothetical protein
MTSWGQSFCRRSRVDEMSHDEFRSRHRTPIVELVPLPSGAQFLNVIESVLSGMARAILHGHTREWRGRGEVNIKQIQSHRIFMRALPSISRLLRQPSEP